MNRSYSCLPMIAGLVMFAGACSKESGMLSSPERAMLKMDQSRDTAGQAFRQMEENAILRDMSVADVHFIAHSSELSGVGEVRLGRLAPILNTYGGLVRYQTYIADGALVEKRIGHIREYLRLAGCSMDRVEVAVAAPGGRGGTAHDAVEAYRRGTATDSTTSGTGGFSPSGFGSQSQGN